VQSGTLTWNPPSSRGGLSILDLGRRRSRLQALLELAPSDSGSARYSSSTVVSRRSAAGISTCTDRGGGGVDAFIPVRQVGPSALAFGLFSARPTYQFPSVPETPLDLVYRLPFAGPLSDEPAPTRCGGPLPADFLPHLPVRVISLQALRRAPTTVDLAGALPFRRLVRRRPLDAGPPPASPEDRARPHRGAAPAAVRAESRHHGRLPRPAGQLSGSVAVDVAGGAGCGTPTLCGLSGTLQVRPGPVLGGRGYLLAYDSASTSSARLRRAVGLAPGRPPWARRSTAWRRGPVGVDLRPRTCGAAARSSAGTVVPARGRRGAICARRAGHGELREL